MANTKTIAVLNVDGTHEFRTVPKSDSLKELQAAVGGLIETVPLSRPNSSRTQVYCNEEGMLLGLPNNPWARYMDAWGHIAGNIVVCYSAKSVTLDDLKKLAPYRRWE